MEMATVKEKEKVTLDFDKSLIAEIDQYASENESDRSKVIRLAVKKFFKDKSPVIQNRQKKAS